jgi:hypothetical protein
MILISNITLSYFTLHTYSDCDIIRETRIPNKRSTSCFARNFCEDEYSVDGDSYELYDFWMYMCSSVFEGQNPLRC